MLKAFTVGLAAAAVAATASDTILWQGVSLKKAGWTPVASSPEIYLFTKGAAVKTAGGGPEVWLRTEWPTVQRSAPPYRSIVELVEVDCAGKVWRDHQQTEYPDNNAEGHGVGEVFTNITFDKNNPPWSDPSWFLHHKAQYDLTRSTLVGLACTKS